MMNVTVAIFVNSAMDVRALSRVLGPIGRGCFSTAGSPMGLNYPRAEALACLAVREIIPAPSKGSPMKAPYSTCGSPWGTPWKVQV